MEILVYRDLQKKFNIYILLLLSAHSEWSPVCGTFSLLCGTKHLAQCSEDSYKCWEQNCPIPGQETAVWLEKAASPVAAGELQLSQLSSVICPLSFVKSPLSYVLCHMSAIIFPVICPMSYILCHMLYVIWGEVLDTRYTHQLRYQPGILISCDINLVY